MAAFRGTLLPGSACCMSAPSRLDIATRQAAAVPPPSGAQGAAAFQRAGRTREACSPSPWVCCCVSHGSRLQPVQAEAPSFHARGSCPGTLQMCVQRLRSERSLPLGTGSGRQHAVAFAAVRHPKGAATGWSHFANICTLIGSSGLWRNTPTKDLHTASELPC